MDGSAFAGRRLGRAYSFEGLQRYQSIHYDAAQDSALQQVASASPAECQQKLDDYDQYQQTLRGLYEQYAQSGVEDSGPERDRAVATGAIAAGHSQQEVLEIVRQGDSAQAVRREFGQREEMDYSRQIVQSQAEIWQRHIEEYRQAQIEAKEKQQREQRQMRQMQRERSQPEL
jgi:N-methylhydantoinase A/oxoprolinase/acetone carboxylase beta subunit